MTNKVQLSLTPYGLTKVFPEETREALGSLSETLGDTTEQLREATKFNSIRDFVGIDYVGYILEKQRYDKENNKWIKIEDYKIFGYAASNYKDTRVAYGHVYRYRVRSVLKHTYKKTTLVLDDSASTVSIDDGQIQDFLDDLDDKEAMVNQMLLFVNSGAARSGANNVFLIDLGDFVVRTDGKNITVARKSAPQKILADLDITSYLFREDLTKNQLREITSSILLSLAAGQEIVKYVSEYYLGPYSRGWMYVSTLDNKLPRYPSFFNVVPDSLNKEVNLFWTYPNNTERDIIGFIVYRRRRGSREWKRLNPLTYSKSYVSEDGKAKKAKLTFDEFNNISSAKITNKIDNVDTKVIKSFAGSLVQVEGLVSENYFVDKDIDFGDEYIYAVSSFDAHGIESPLSTQIRTSLNPDYKKTKRELENKWISGPGAFQNSPRLRMKKFRNRKPPLVAKESLELEVNDKFSEDNINFVIKVTSLDTHESKQFSLKLKNTNLRNESDDNVGT